jgi:hypothetical protein
MLNKYYQGIAIACFLLMSLAGCQKSDPDDHLFKDQEMALKKAQSVQKMLTEKIDQDRKAIQEATE